jgi:hypothetical protein
MEPFSFNSNHYFLPAPGAPPGGAIAVTGMLWDFPVLFPPLPPPPIGDPNTVGMQAGALYHHHAEMEFLRVRNHQLSERVDEQKQEAVKSRELIHTLESTLALVQAELDDFRQQEEAQIKLSEGIWGPIVRPDPDGSWDPEPVLLDGPVMLSGSEEDMDGRPLTLGRVLRGLGYRCTQAEVRKLGALLHHAYEKAHGHPPIPTIYYDSDGQADRIGCFTERDREFITAVVQERLDRLAWDSADL